MKIFQLPIGALLLVGTTVLAVVTNSTRSVNGTGHSTVMNVPSGVISNMPSSVIQKPSGVIKNMPSGVVSNMPDGVITNPPDDTTGDATNLPPQPVP
jgi:hypothetical protein